MSQIVLIEIMDEWEQFRYRKKIYIPEYAILFYVNSHGPLNGMHFYILNNPSKILNQIFLIEGKTEFYRWFNQDLIEYIKWKINKNHPLQSGQYKDRKTYTHRN